MKDIKLNGIILYVMDYKNSYSTMSDATVYGYVVYEMLNKINESKMSADLKKFALAIRGMLMRGEFVCVLYDFESRYVNDIYVENDRICLGFYEGGELFIDDKNLPMMTYNQSTDQLFFYMENGENEAEYTPTPVYVNVYSFDSIYVRKLLTPVYAANIILESNFVSNYTKRTFMCHMVCHVRPGYSSILYKIAEIIHSGLRLNWCFSHLSITVDGRVQIHHPCGAPPITISESGYCFSEVSGTNTHYTWMISEEYCEITRANLFADLMEEVKSLPFIMSA